MLTNPVVCPRCDGQGHIKKVLLKNQAAVFVCDECDATWLDFKDIGRKPWLDLGTYLENQGYSLSEVSFTEK